MIVHTSLFGIGAGQELIENVKGTFIFGLADRTGLLQEVSLDIGTRNIAGSIKINPNKFALNKEMQLFNKNESIEKCKCKRLFQNLRNEMNYRS